MRVILIICLIVISIKGYSQSHLKIGLEKYQSDNNIVINNTDSLKRVVFIGNSITEQWVKIRPDFFVDNNYIGRGISGQTTVQILLRFRQDVIDLKPKVVVILAGTNDIARNLGYIPHEAILDNIKSMCELAKINNINVVLCSVLPSKKYYWTKEEIYPSIEIPKFNKLLEEYAFNNSIKYIDFYTELVDKNNDNYGGLLPFLTTDGVHLNADGYKVMEEVFNREFEK